MKEYQKKNEFIIEQEPLAVEDHELEAAEQKSREKDKLRALGRTGRTPKYQEYIVNEEFKFSFTRRNRTQEIKKRIQKIDSSSTALNSKLRDIRKEVVRLSSQTNKTRSNRLA